MALLSSSLATLLAVGTSGLWWGGALLASLLAALVGKSEVQALEDPFTLAFELTGGNTLVVGSLGACLVDLEVKLNIGKLPLGGLELVTQASVVQRLVEALDPPESHFCLLTTSSSSCKP